MKCKINDGHYLELMDRLHVITCNLEDHLMNHPLTREDKEVEKLIKYSIINLSHAYQVVGSKMYENEKRKNPISKVILGRRKKSKKKGLDNSKKFY